LTDLTRSSPPRADALTPSTPRAQGFVSRLEDVRCPRCQHAIDKGRLLDAGEWGYITCGKRPRAGAEPCACKILVMFFVRRNEPRDDAVPRSQRSVRAYVAEVDWREVEHFEQQRMDVDAILCHLQRYDIQRGGASRFRA
jgi:hypothetical protein